MVDTNKSTSNDNSDLDSILMPPELRRFYREVHPEMSTSDAYFTMMACIKFSAFVLRRWDYDYTEEFVDRFINNNEQIKMALNLASEEQRVSELLSIQKSACESYGNNRIDLEALRSIMEVTSRLVTASDGISKSRGLHSVSKETIFKMLKRAQDEGFEMDLPEL